MALTHDDLVRLLLALAILLAAARLLGELAVRFRQPSILGEILAGILLGPTVLGRLAPAAFAWIFPTTGGFAPALEAFTTVAIVLFLMTAGMEVDLTTVWRQGRTALSVSMVGLVPSFLAGLALGHWFPVFMGAQPQVGDWLFAVFLGTALSVSALPIIVKILMDLNIFRSDLGMVVVSSAILNDLLGWILFAIVLSMVDVSGVTMGVGFTVALVLVFVFGVLTLGRLGMHRALPWLQAHATYPGGVLGFALAGALLCAAFTEWIGIHAIFGAFIFGVALGDSTHLRARTRTMVEQFIGFIFAPIFFAGIGLQVDFLGALDPWLTLVVVVVGSPIMIFGSTLGARLSGWPNRESLAIGMAMNTRGTMQIILGLLALRYGVITERLFVALVIMALLTSLASGSLIQRVLGRRRVARFLDFFSSKTFAPWLEAKTAREAIDELVAVAAAAHGLKGPAVAQRVWDRESAASTALPGGLCLPHARLPQLKSPIVAVGRSRKGIDFDAPDGAPARLIFLILTPENDHQSQLEILADITTVFAEPRNVERTLRAATYTEFAAVVKREAPGREHTEPSRF